MIELNALSLLWTKRLGRAPDRDGAATDQGTGAQPSDAGLTPSTQHVSELLGPEPPGPTCCWYYDTCCWVKC